MRKNWNNMIMTDNIDCVSTYIIWICFFLMKICISVDPHFSHAFLLDGETRFFYLMKSWILEKKTWNRHLFLFYFLKEKQNKKENSIELFIWKIHICKNRVWIWGSSYLLRRYNDELYHLSPYTYGIY